MRGYPPFYQAVWRLVTTIPTGETRTYGWVARRLGRPGAARAVGRALAANPFAPRIPCHRVVKADGSLGGYSARGGVASKRLRLLREGALAEIGGRARSSAWRASKPLMYVRSMYRRKRKRQPQNPARSAR